MINRTITSYTILNYFSEKGISQIDLYVPFACKCISKNASQTVSIEDLKNGSLRNMAYQKYIKEFLLVY